MPVQKTTLLVVVETIVKQVIYVVVLVLWWCVGLPVTLPILLCIPVLYLFAWSVLCGVECLQKRTTETRLTPEELVVLDKVGSGAVVQSLLFLSSPIDLDRLREKIRCGIANDSRSTMLQNLTRCLRLNDVPLWRETTDFDVNNHVFETEATFNSLADIRNYITKCSTEPLNLTRPLWEIISCSLLNEGFLVVRFHPCVMSGRTAINFLCDRLADAPCIYTSPHRFPEALSWKRALYKWFMLPWKLMSSRADRVHRRTCGDDYFSKKSSMDFATMCRGNRKCSWSSKIHLPALKHSVAVLRSTVSAVSLGALASSLRLVPNTFNDVESFPVKLIYDLSNNGKSRSPRAVYWENNISAPCKIEGAIPCQWMLRKSLSSLKKNIFPCISTTTIKLLRMFCSLGVSLKVLSSSIKERALCAFTSLSGPTATLYVCGRRVQNICTWYPVTSDVVLTATVMTYADEFRICLQTWENSGLDPQELVEECQRQIGILIEQLKHRHVPKKKKLYYDDGEGDEFDLACEEDDDVTMAHAPSSRPGSKLFFQRTKIHSSNGNVATVSRETDVESAPDTVHKRGNATEPRDIVFSEISRSPSLDEVGATSINVPSLFTTDYEVGLDISPAVERRHSTSLL